MKLPADVVFAREPFTVDLFNEALPLLVSHWHEIAHFADIPLNPDLSFYKGCENAGALRVYTARKDGVVHGYAVFVVRRNAHYQTSLQAVQDVIYIRPESRGGLGRKFLRFCDDQLRAEGVQAVYHHVKAAHNFGLVLQKLGYELVDLIYTKRLDKET